jgi:NhaP-type Na+/H+ or K+/H+ antiporter
VLAVTTLGLLFGMMEIREKPQLNNFIAIFTNFLKIVMFVLLGLLINLSFSYIFIIKSIILFILYLGVRYLAVHITFLGYNMPFKEKIFMSFNIAKGVPVAVVAFILASLLNAELAYIIDLTFLFIFYSIVVNSIAIGFFKHLVTTDRLPKKSRKVKAS